MLGRGCVVSRLQKLLYDKGLLEPNSRHQVIDKVVPAEQDKAAQPCTTQIQAHTRIMHDVKYTSLRFGGASALWAAFGDSGLVKRWGRWASDCFHGYLWDSREGSRGVAAAMTTADLTPV